MDDVTPSSVRQAQVTLGVSALGLLLLGPLLALQQAGLGMTDASVNPWFSVVLGAGLGLGVGALFWGLAALCAASAVLLGRRGALGWGLGVLSGVLLVPACCVLPGVFVLGALLREESRAHFVKPSRIAESATS